jgi:hypothetical protein
MVVAAPSQSATEPDKSGRAKFIKRADSICRPYRAEAKRRIDHGVRFLLRRHPLEVRAGNHFIRAYREMREAYRQVAQLPRPFEYHRRIARWLRRERHATAVGVKSAVALKRHRYARSRKRARRAALFERLAARPVRNFDFEHCRPL